MNYRRLVGIDLGITSAHTVRVLDGEGNTIAKRKCFPTTESLSEIEALSLTGCPEGTVLEVVMEPTGPAWLPIVVFFSARGHRVFRVSSQKAADLRRFLSRHTKTNGIDADTLARLPLFDPAGLQPLRLPGPERAALDRRVRACDRLTQAGAIHKVRIKDLVRQLIPMSPLYGDLGVADLTILERWADPNALVKLGEKRLAALIAKASHNHQGLTRARQWLDAARAALELYDRHPAVAFGDLAAEVATEVRLLRAVQAELSAHATVREEAYRMVDPGTLARTLPGLAEVGGPALVAAMGDPSRFTRGKQFRSFSGLTPKASETGDTDRRGPAHVQGWFVAAAHNAGTRRRHCPQTGSSAGPSLLRPDGRAGQGPPRRSLRRRRQPVRAGMGGDGARHAVRHLRHRRSSGQRRGGQGNHRRALQGDRRGAGPPALQEERGEGPQERPLGTIDATRSRRRQTGPPSPRGILRPRKLTRQEGPYVFAEISTLTEHPP